MVDRGSLRHQAAGGGRAGERDVVDVRVCRQRRACFMAEAGNDVERPGRQPDCGGQFGELEQREAGVFRRLDHAGIAGGERGAHRAPEDLHRVVPRDDVAGHAMRLANGHDGVAALVGQGFAVQLVAGACVVLEVAREGDGIGACLLHRLAGVAAFQQRQFVGVVGDGLRQLHHQPAAFQCGKASPGPIPAVIGGARCLDGSLDIGGVAACQVGEDTAVGRVDHRNGAAGGRRGPAVVDEVGSLGRGCHACFCGMGKGGLSPGRDLTRCLIFVRCKSESYNLVVCGVCHTSSTRDIP